MGSRPKVPKRGEIYSIDPNPVAGREMRDRHYWIVLTPEAVNAHGVAVAVAISTAATGARAAGLTVRASGGGVTGVAVCTHLRSFDLRARLADGTARLAGVADAATVDEIASRVASLIDPAPET
ncbi:type II toxin-antitoxin system PemK/MazF family toxin [Methylobacterium sp. Gmos1]